MSIDTVSTARKYAFYCNPITNKGFDSLARTGPTLGQTEQSLYYSLPSACQARRLR